MQVELLGNVETAEKQNGALIIKTAIAHARIMVYSDTIIRVCVTKKDKQPDESLAVIQEPQESFTYQKLANTIEVNTSAVKLIINKNPLRFSFFTADGKPLSSDDQRFGTTLDGDKV